MKKILLLLLSFILIFSLSACGTKESAYPTDKQILQDMQDNVNTLPVGTEEVFTFVSVGDPVIDTGMLIIYGTITRKSKYKDDKDTIEIKALYRIYENATDKSKVYEYDSTLTA